MMKGLGNLMKQAQEMQSKMNQVQEELATVEVEGSAGGGMVKIILNGKGDMRQIVLDPSIVNAEEKDMLEDMILAAFNDAKDKANAKSSEMMKGVTGGMPLPPGMKLPF